MALLALCLIAGVVLVVPARANVALQNCGYGATVNAPYNVFVIYWNGTTSDPNTEQAFDTAFLASAFSTYYASPGLPGTPYNGALTQYYSQSGSPTCAQPIYITNDVLGPPPATGVRKDPGSSPSCASEKAMVDAVAAAYPFETPAIFVVQWGPGPTGTMGAGFAANSCAQAAVCGAHTSTGSPNYNVFIEVPYYSSSWPGSGCGPSIYDGLSSTLNHELAESLTSPFWDQSGLEGWSESPPSEYQEQVADLCLYDPNGAFALQKVQVIPTGNTAASAAVDIQPLWSNLADGGAGACVYSYDPNWSVFFLSSSSGKIVFEPDNDGLATTWASSSSLGHAPAVVHWGPYRYDLFGYGPLTPPHLRHKYQSGYPGSGNAATGADDWGAPPTGDTFITSTSDGYEAGPSVSTWGASRVDVFAAVTTSSTDNILHRSWDNGTDSGWLTSIGIPSGAGSLSSAPAAVSAVYGRIDLFVLMGDGNVYQTTCTDDSCTGSTSFSAWTSVGHPSSRTLAGSPAAASWGPTFSNTNGGSPPRVDVFLRNTSGNLSHYYVDSSGSGWDEWLPPSGTSVGYPPSAVGLGDMRIGVSAIAGSGTDLLVWISDWGTNTTTKVSTAVPSSTTGIAMTYSFPGEP